MPEPIIFVVDDDPRDARVDRRGARAAVRRRLPDPDRQRRPRRWPDSREACEDGEPVALVIAGRRDPRCPALDWLARAHDALPARPAAARS